MKGYTYHKRNYDDGRAVHYIIADADGIIVFSRIKSENRIGYYPEEDNFVGDRRRGYGFGKVIDQSVIDILDSRFLSNT